MANFHIEKKIGRGQFSEVYKATYLLDGQLVALKKVQVQLFVLSRHTCGVRSHCSAMSFPVYVYYSGNWCFAS